MQEVTQRIYHLFQQSPWWHRYGASQPAAQPYFTALLYRKDTFKPAGPFQSHDFSNSSMGKHHWYKHSGRCKSYLKRTVHSCDMHSAL